MRTMENKLLSVFLEDSISGKVVCTKITDTPIGILSLYQKGNKKVSIDSKCMAAGSYGIKFLDDVDGETGYSLVSKEVISLVGQLYTHMMTAGDTGYIIGGDLRIEDGGNGSLKVVHEDFNLLYNVETKVFGCNKLYISDKSALSRAKDTLELIISKLNTASKGYPLSSITIMPSYKGTAELFLVDSLETIGEYSLYCGTSESLYVERAVKGNMSKVFILKDSEFGGPNETYRR